MQLSAIVPSLPPEISRGLEKEYSELESRFSKRDWGPAELNGGRFAEVLLRYLEWKGFNRFTPIGTKLPRTRIANAVKNNTAIPEGLRFHVLMAAELLLDVRNRRDVGHVGAGINVNEMDSRLVKRLASWTLSEIIRQESGVTPEIAQATVDRLSARNLSLLEEVGGDLIVLSTNMKTEHRAMVALYQRYPESYPIETLQAAVLYKNASRFRDLLEKLASQAFVHIKGDQVYITSKGVVWIDKNIDLKLKV